MPNEVTACLKVCAFVDEKLDWKLNDETNVAIKLPCRNLFCSGLNLPWKGEGQPDAFSPWCLSGYFWFGACHYSNSLCCEISAWQSALYLIELTIHFASKCPSPPEYVEGMLLFYRIHLHCYKIFLPVFNTVWHCLSLCSCTFHFNYREEDKKLPQHPSG